LQARFEIAAQTGYTLRAPWVDRVKAVASRTKETYVMSNNHNIGKSTANALQLTSILRAVPIRAPLTLAQHYARELEGFVKSWLERETSSR
jgi:hypothetical protein